MKFLKDEHGFTQWLILIILMLGIGVGVWVAQVRTNLVPQAKVQQHHLQPASIALKTGSPVELNKAFDLTVLVRSDTDPIRLITTHLTFDPQSVEILKINTPQVATNSGVIYATVSAEQTVPQISQWLETLFDNKTGKATITGLLGDGNLKTVPDQEPFNFVTLSLKAKKLPTEIRIDDTSLLLRAADNANILAKTERLLIELQQATPGATPN